MKRFQLEHIIRAGGSIADDEEIIVLGSSSILAQFPNISEEVLLSIEADVFPKNKPDMADFKKAKNRGTVSEAPTQQKA